MDHSLICPLQQQRGDGVVLPVQNEHQRGSLLPSGAKIKQASFLNCRQVMKGLSQLLTSFAVALIPAQSQAAQSTAHETHNCYAGTFLHASEIGQEPSMSSSALTNTALYSSMIRQAAV